MEFLREERKLPKKEALSLLSVVRHGVATCHENPSSPSFAAWNSPHRREAEKNFRHQLWLHMAHPRQARMLRTECVDALAVAYIRLSAQLPWKEPPRQILFLLLNLIAAGVEEGPKEMLRMTKLWSQEKQPRSKHEAKESLRRREDYLDALYGWNALKRVDPSFAGGSSRASLWLVPIIVLLLLANIVVFLWRGGYLPVEPPTVADSKDEPSSIPVVDL